MALKLIKAIVTQHSNAILTGLLEDKAKISKMLYEENDFLQVYFEVGSFLQAVELPRVLQGSAEGTDPWQQRGADRPILTC
jgi:hypothetical protein